MAPKRTELPSNSPIASIHSLYIALLPYFRLTFNVVLFSPLSSSSYHFTKGDTRHAAAVSAFVKCKLASLSPLIPSLPPPFLPPFMFVLGFSKPPYQITPLFSAFLHIADAAVRWTMDAVVV